MGLSVQKRRLTAAATVALCTAFAAVPAFWLTTPATAQTAAPAQAAPSSPQAAPQAVPQAAPVGGGSVVTVEGAAALSKTLNDLIGKYISQPAKGGVIVGNVPIVMPSGDSYLVALPPLSIRGENQERLDIAGVSLSIKPTADQTYAVGITLPPSLVYQENSDAVMVFTIGEQKISGVWSQPAGSFLSMDVNMTDVQATSVYEDYWFGIGSLNFSQDLRPDTAGWSGPLALALSDVRLDKGDDTLFSAGGITSETLYSRVRLNRLGDIAALGESAANAAQPTQDDVAKMIDSIIAAMRDLLGGMSSRLRLSDVALYDPDTKETVGFDLASFSSGISDLDRDTASATAGFEIKGLSFDPAPTSEAVLPSSGELKLSLHNIPVAKLLGLLKAVTIPPAPGSTPVDPVSEATNILTAAKLTLKLDQLGIAAPAGQADAKGEAVANKDSAFGAVGKAKLTLNGVDKLLNDLKPKKPGGKVDAENADLVGALTMLKAMGRPDKDKDGKAVLSYTFELKTDGTMLVNDTDLAPLLSGGGQAAPSGKTEGKKK